VHAKYGRAVPSLKNIYFVHIMSDSFL
jgi:hypothetical protein